MSTNVEMMILQLSTLFPRVYKYNSPGGTNDTQNLLIVTQQNLHFLSMHSTNIALEIFPVPLGAICNIQTLYACSLSTALHVSLPAPAAWDLLSTVDFSRLIVNLSAARCTVLGSNHAKHPTATQ
jgi:hypothetical protein